MSFINELDKTLDKEYNVSITENGALGYSTVNPFVDFYFSIASFRSVTEKTIISRFMKMYLSSKVLALRTLFNVRDVREGIGERKTFRIIMEYLATYDPEIVKKLIPLISEYGRYDDLLVLLDTAVKKDVVKLILTTLRSDMSNMRGKNPISLMAKWMPSENASSAETKRFAKILIKEMSLSSKQYRQMLSKLREYLRVVERSMSAKEWENINYSAVPSRANLIYNDAFLRNDEERRRAFLASLEKGETKINAGVLFPQDIVHKYTNCYNLRAADAGIESLWKALPDTVKGDNSTIVVGDGSGSMNSEIGNTNVTAHDVADALAIYFAERCSGEFKNTYITFGANPKLVHLTGETLRDNVEIARRNDDCSNTNIEKVFDLILKTAVNNEMKQEDMPKNVLIISDMEFDSATSRSYGYGWINADGRSSPSKRLFEIISDKFKEHGYVMPKLIFWNVNSRTNTIPVKENEMGVALISGFSPNIVTMVMNNETDPFKILLKTINSERYDAVEKALK